MIPRRTPLTRTRIKRTPKARARKNLISECDQLVRALIMARDGNKCVKCEATDNLQAAHILSKGHYGRIRFELLNVISLCLRDHIFGAHKDPSDFMDWLNKAYPGRVEQLRIMAATAAKPDLKMLVLCLRKEVSELTL